MIFFFKQKTAYEMRIGDWSSDVCSSELNDVISAPVPQTPPSAAPPAYPFILFLTENVGAFEAYGLEASLDGQFEQGWKWALNYTWTKAKQHIKGNTGGQFEWPLALDSATPEHKIR